MKKHCIKFLMFLNLFIMPAFADNWGDIHVYMPFPQTSMDIEHLSDDISSEIEMHVSLGHGVFEDAVFFSLTSLFNDKLQVNDYQNIVTNTLKSAPQAQYIIFDVTQLNSAQLTKSQDTIYQIERYFLAQKHSLKFGFVIDYGADATTNARILQLLTQNPVNTSYLYIQSDIGAFITDLSRTNQYSVFTKNLDFLNLSSIEINETNLPNVISFLQETSNLIAIDLSNVFLKTFTNSESFEARTKFLSPVANALKKLSKISYFRISSNALDEPAAIVIADVVKQYKNLIYVNVRYNNFAGNGANEFLRALAPAKLLTFIDIGYNRFHAQNADDFVNVLKGKPSIAYIDISYNFFASEGSHKIRVAVSDILILQSLQVLKFRNNYFVYKHFVDETKISHNFSKLFYMDFGENYFYTKASLSYAKSVTFPITLKYLYFDANNMNTSRLAEISDSLVNADRMRYLDISNNNIDGQGIDSVVKILIRTKTLSGINLAGNEFTESEMATLAHALSTLPEINILNISNNKVGSDSIQILAKHFAQNRKLSRMILTNVDLSDANAIVLASALNAQSEISVLDVSFNNIDKSGLKSLLDSLKNKQKFTRLILDGNKVSCDDVTTLIGTPKFKCL